MIYLDHNATTPLDPRVLDAMLPFLKEGFGNAASRHHTLGTDAAAAVETARAQVAAVIGAQPREIVWTSGATESNNLAIKGVAAAQTYAKKRHLITVATEHRAVHDPCDHLEHGGYRLSVLDVDRLGHLDLAALEKAIGEDTLLVSVMHANNETGVLHPIREIGALCKKKGVLFHTDAAQSFGKEPIDVAADSIDLLSASGHKIHGPKGVAFLYVRHRDPHVRCEPLIHGGGHERGLRSGTLNVPAIVGMGVAASLCAPEEQDRIRALRDRLEKALGAPVNGDPVRRLANTTNLSFPGVEAAALMKRLPNVALSTSSACTSASMQPSYVLRAMGCDEATIGASLRFSLGRYSNIEDIDAAVSMIRFALRQ
jgi:cysteine desulfurase